MRLGERPVRCYSRQASIGGSFAIALGVLVLAFEAAFVGGISGTPETALFAAEAPVPARKVDPRGGVASVDAAACALFVGFMGAKNWAAGSSSSLP